MKLKNIKISTILIYLTFIVIAVIVFGPLLITFFAAFKTSLEYAKDFSWKLPSGLYLDNFVTVFKEGKMVLGFKNSMILVIFTILINTVLASMVAYILARFEFKFKKLFMFVFLLGMLVPSFVTEIARFGLIKSFGAYNTIAAPIIIYAGTDLMQIYIYRQFINAIPISLDQSARMDGCSYFGIYRRIIMPNIIPAIATLAILKMVEIINDMYIPYLYMPAERLRTLTTALMSFAGSKSGIFVELSAGVVLVMLPTLLIYLFFSKYILKGVVAGAVKE